ncbi:TatD family hydrolase [Olivibacter sp. XZL3]|uniref:TatD family hydrolase n=1 Tax=Olivibacter sp. XZL3 TaxID=1735116 RepID=UPI001064A45C|nr:TatD family hydrolase [Olivibacter sp. XZL3]
MQRFINIHTHSSQQDNTLRVVNIAEDYRQCTKFDPCSIGIHPWFLSPDEIGQQLDDLIRYAVNKEVFAIGECGLDKLCKTAWFLQENVFLKQIAIANQVGKPLIVHCVKAYGEVVQCLQKMANNVPVIFHGFNKKTSVAQSLIEKGYYLSFGHAIIAEQNLESLKLCPPSQLFLETDDTERKIEAVYEKVSYVLGIPMDKLIKQLQMNYNRIKKKTI